MRTLLIACVSFAVAIAAGCSSDHTGVPAGPPFNPIGTEPTSGDAGGSSVADLFELLCNQNCANIEATCGPRFPAKYCTPGCRLNLNYFRGCEAEEFIYLSCLGTSRVDCSFGFPQTPQCDPALQAVAMCQSQPPPGF